MVNYNILEGIMSENRNIMSENEAIRLGEEIRQRLENNNHSYSFTKLLNEIKEKKEQIENVSKDEKSDQAKIFLSSEWEDVLRQAFLIDELGISLKLFNTKNEMKEYLSTYYKISSLQGNSYITKNNEKYEIGMFRFDILGFIHELGHIVQGDVVKAGEILWDRPETDEGERRLNIFARSFWMPRKLFEKIVVENSVNGECMLKKVADFFAVDYTSVYLRGKELCFWN